MKLKKKLNLLKEVKTRIWQDRTRTDPTKRKFTDENGVEQNVHIEEIQSNITQSGTPVNATTMNNIEKNLGTYGNDTYDSTATYSIGDVVTHNALLYRAKQDIDTAEEWTAAHWEETSALDELKKTSGNEVLISDDEEDITYQTKIFVDSDTGTAKYRDTDDNFVPLKDNEVVISDTEPTSADNELWIDTSSNATYMNQEVNIGATNPNNTPTWFKQSKNLFNINSMIELVGSYRAFGNGQIVSSSAYNGFKIPIKPNTTYTITINTNYSNLCYWNASFTRIDGEAFSHSGGSGTLTTPANCYYITLAVQNNFTQVMLNEGDIAETYEPYIRKAININGEDEYYTNDYSVAEQVIGKWIDGKPIYRSVIEYTLSIDTSTYYGTYTGAADIIKSIDTLVDYKFYIYNGTLIFPIPNFGGTNNDRDCGIYIQRSYGGIGFQCFARSINNFNGKPAQIILEYTKTTD